MTKGDPILKTFDEEEMRGARKAILDADDCPHGEEHPEQCYICMAEAMHSALGVIVTTSATKRIDPVTIISACAFLALTTAERVKGGGNIDELSEIMQDVVNMHINDPGFQSSMQAVRDADEKLLAAMKNPN